MRQDASQMALRRTGGSRDAPARIMDARGGI